MLRTIVIGSVGAVVIGGCGVAALAATGSTAAPTPSSTTTSSTHSGAAKGKHDGRRGKLRALARHAEHGTVTVKTKDGFTTFDFGRGTVLSSSPTSLVVDTPDGTKMTFTLNSDTKYHQRSDGKGSTATYSVLHGGDTVAVLGKAATTSGTPVATQVLDLGKK